MPFGVPYNYLRNFKGEMYLIIFRIYHQMTHKIAEGDWGQSLQKTKYFMSKKVRQPFNNSRNVR